MGRFLWHFKIIKVSFSLSVKGEEIFSRHQRENRIVPEHTSEYQSNTLFIAHLKANNQ